MLCACPAPACSASTPDCCHCWCLLLLVLLSLLLLLLLLCCCHFVANHSTLTKLGEPPLPACLPACLRRVLVLVLCLALPYSSPLISSPLYSHTTTISLPSPAASLPSFVCIDAHPPASATAHNLGALGLDAATAAALTPPSITHQRAAAGELSTYCCCYRRCALALALALHPSPKPHSSCWLHAGPALTHPPLPPQSACSRPRTHTLSLTT